jgi:rSAM/selenodomain-associated transferase 1
MVKEPRPGKVKTRLAREIGVIPATWWFRRQVRALLRRLQDPRWDLVLSVAPDHAGLTSRQFPARLARVPQGRGDLGARMTRQMRNRPVCVIGSDIPGVRPAHIAKAFAALRSHDVVFGPAPDGGFWLVGHSARRAVSPGMFAGARWSSAHAMADSVASVKGHAVAFVDVLEDVDSAADLGRISR